MRLLGILIFLLAGVVHANLSGTEYKTAVTLAECDDTITSVAEFAAIDFNVDGPVFCFGFADYTSEGTITLTADGISGTERVLRLTAGSGTHPADQTSGNRAIIQNIVMDNADYWILDGITLDGNDTVDTLEMKNGTSNTVVNRVLIESAHIRSIIIKDSSNDNLIQDSVLRNCRQTDNDTFGVAVNVINTDGIIDGTDIVENEIYNCGDGVQLVSEAARNATYPNTVIAGNDIYLTTDYYTDCGGNLDPTGDCAFGENAVDIKAGGTSSSDYVKVMDNRVWGYRVTNNGSSPGAAITLSSVAKEYVLLRYNIISDSPRGIAMLATDNNISVVDNIIYNIHNPVSATNTFSIMMYGDSSELYRNTLIDSEYKGIQLSDPEDLDVKCNVSISSNASTFGTQTNLEADYNMWYDSTSIDVPGTNDKDLSSLKDNDLCYDRKLITGSENVCITSGAYRNNICNYDFTSRSGLGVNDLDWTLGPN